MKVRRRYQSKRKARIDALAHEVGKRLFIIIGLIAMALLVVLFLRPQTFEVDDSTHRFGEVEKVVPVAQTHRLNASANHLDERESLSGFRDLRRSSAHDRLESYSHRMAQNTSPPY